jgi:hypothetical protein
VDVEVHHGLAGDLASVEADVVAVGGELAVQGGLDVVDELRQGELLLAGGVEPGGMDGRITVGRNAARNAAPSWRTSLATCGFEPRAIESPSCRVIAMNGIYW